MLQVMGTNTWAFGADPAMLVEGALAFADEVRERGIAELRGAWLAEHDRVMWCTWDTDDLEALQAAFDEMNSQTGLTSELTVMHTFYSTLQETTAV